MTQPPREIALCITDLDVGGAERCLVELAVRIDPRRFRPVVYTLAPPPAEEQHELVDRLAAAGIACHHLGATRPVYFLRTVRWLARLLKSQRAELLQGFLFHANFVGRLAARWAGVPWVCSGIRVAEREKRWHLTLDRLTGRLVDRYACVSQAVADFSRDVARLPAAKLAVIANGVETTRFAAARPAELAECGIPSGSRVAVFIGRLEAQKNLDWLLTTVPAWLPTGSDGHLLIVGRGPLQAALQQRCCDLAIADRVHFAGWRADVPEILAASKLLVLPSAWEGMPNVVLEAMAAGRPVVCSDVEGVGELLGPLADRQTFRPGNRDGLSQRVKSLLADPAAAAALGAANRDRCRQHFTLEKMAEAYQALWDALTARATDNTSART